MLRVYSPSLPVDDRSRYSSHAPYTPPLRDSYSHSSSMSVIALGNPSLPQRPASPAAPTPPTMYLTSNDSQAALEPPRPPKFIPRNHNPRSNDFSSSAPPDVASETVQLQSSAAAGRDTLFGRSVSPVSTVQQESEEDEIKEDPAKVSLAQDIKEDVAAMPTPPPEMLVVQKEGVWYCHAEDYPKECKGNPTPERKAAREAWIKSIKRRLKREGKVPGPTRWRTDGLAVDWTLRDLDMSDIEVVEETTRSAPTPPRTDVRVERPSSTSAHSSSSSSSSDSSPEAPRASLPEQPRRHSSARGKDMSTATCTTVSEDDLIPTFTTARGTFHAAPNEFKGGCCVAIPHRLAHKHDKSKHRIAWRAAQLARYELHDSIGVQQYKVKAVFTKRGLELEWLRCEPDEYAQLVKARQEEIERKERESRLQMGPGAEPTAHRVTLSTAGEHAAAPSARPLSPNKRKRSDESSQPRRSKPPSAELSPERDAVTTTPVSEDEAIPTIVDSEGTWHPTPKGSRSIIIPMRYAGKQREGREFDDWVQHQVSCHEISSASGCPMYIVSVDFRDNRHITISWVQKSNQDCLPPGKPAPGSDVQPRGVNPIWSEDEPIATRITEEGVFHRRPKSLRHVCLPERFATTESRGTAAYAEWLEAQLVRHELRDEDDVPRYTVKSRITQRGTLVIDWIPCSEYNEAKEQRRAALAAVANLKAGYARPSPSELFPDTCRLPRLGKAKAFITPRGSRYLYPSKKLSTPKEWESWTKSQKVRFAFRDNDNVSLYDVETMPTGYGCKITWKERDAEEYSEEAEVKARMRKEAEKKNKKKKKDKSAVVISQLDSADARMDAYLAANKTPSGKKSPGKRGSPVRPTLHLASASSMPPPAAPEDTRKRKASNEPEEESKRRREESTPRDAVFSLAEVAPAAAIASGFGAVTPSPPDQAILHSTWSPNDSSKAQAMQAPHDQPGWEELLLQPADDSGLRLSSDFSAFARAQSVQAPASESTVQRPPLPAADDSSAPASERVAQYKSKVTELFDRLEKWNDLFETYPERRKTMERQMERTEAKLFEVQGLLSAAEREVVKAE